MVSNERKAKKRRLFKQREELLERAKQYRLNAERLPKNIKDPKRDHLLAEAKKLEEQAKMKDDKLKKLEK